MATNKRITARQHKDARMAINPSELRHPETTRQTASMFGALLIAAIVCGVLNSVPALEASDYLETLAAHESRILVAVFFQAAMAVIYVAIAVIMYPLVRIDSRNSALAYVTFRSIGAGFLFVGIVTLLLLLALGRRLAQAGAPAAADAALIGGLLRQGRDWLNHIGMILPWSIGGLFLYRAFLRTGVIPRWLAIWGLVGTALTLVATILYMLDQIQIVTVAYFALNAPTALLEVTLAVYLIARGFQHSEPALQPSAHN